MSPIYLAFLGTMFTFLATALGAATVFFFKKDIPHGMQRAFLGFAAGVMIAASVWSLLVPAMEMAEKSGALCVGRRVSAGAGPSAPSPASRQR